MEEYQQGDKDEKRGEKVGEGNKERRFRQGNAHFEAATSLAAPSWLPFPL